MNAGTRFAWSVRRELWEHRATWLAPLAVAGVVLFAFLFHLPKIGNVVQLLPKLAPAKQVIAVVTPYSLAASVIVFTSFLVAMFYCLDALYGERRDRSILFWKSMPVSDFTTVLSKAFMPLVVMPLAAFAIAVATQAILLALGSAVLAAKGIDLTAMWSRLPLFQITLVMLYGLAVHSLWYAPIYAWLLLVSAWARKAPFLWAVLPVFAAFVVEQIAFGTGHVASLVQYRFMGAMREAFVRNAMKEPITELAQVDPARFFASTGLWLGLAFAVAFLAAAIWLRRRREPI